MLLHSIFNQSREVAPSFSVTLEVHPLMPRHAYECESQSPEQTVSQELISERLGDVVPGKVMGPVDLYDNSSPAEMEEADIDAE